MSNFKNAYDAVLKILLHSSSLMHDEYWYSNYYVPYFFEMEDHYFPYNCGVWGEKYSSTDVQKLEDQGITRENVTKIRDISRELRNKMFLDISDQVSSPSIAKLGLIFYKDRIDDIKETMDELNELYEECECPLKDEYELVNRDLGGHNLPKDHFIILNPYKLIQDAQQLVQCFVDEMKSNEVSVSMKSFIFSKEFKLLSTFKDDIKDKNLSKDETNNLLSAWTLLIVKGFTLNQVKIKISQKEIMKIRDNRLDYLIYSNKGETDDDIQLYSEMKALYYYGEQIYKSSSDLNEEILNEIYQKHKNDEAGSVLKPLIEELIPYYNSLITPEGFIKLTFKVTDIYGEFTINKDYGNKYNEKYFDHLEGGRRLICFWPNYIPLKLINSPGEKYNELVKRYLYMYAGEKFNPAYIELPELEEIDDLDTLENQKLYIVWYLVTAERSHYHKIFCPDELSLIMALLNWKIEGDSEDARKLEQYFRNSIDINMKNYGYIDLKKEIAYHAKYIISTVLPATEPLNPSEIKENLRKNSAKYKDKERPDGISSLGGCCTIQ